MTFFCRRGGVWRRLLVGLLATAALASGTAAAETYSFGVVPQFEARKMFGIWQPIADEMEKRTGDRFVLVVPLSVAEFERKLGAGEFDFVYGNPYLVLHANAKQGYLPLVRDRVPLRGILLVRKDSPVRTLAELDGKALAVPSANALGASLMLRAELSELFGIRMKMLDVRTHTSAYLNALNRITDACGGVEKTLAEQEPAVRDALRTIHTTRDMPSHPLAAHPRVAKAARERARQALLAMAGVPAGKKLLDEVPMTEPVATSIDDYRALRAWRLEAYWIDQGG